MNLKILLIYILFHFSSSDNIYNYYELAVQKWCTSKYMIHGLWPQINSSTYPENCENVYYIEPTGNLLKNMENYWYSCDNNLWEHEWKKHGSCMKEKYNIDENYYFNITLNLFLENQNLLKKCINNDCLLSCFDLDFNLIDC